MSTAQALVKEPIVKPALKPDILAPHRPQIGIFGGTFNPVHNGHLLMAETVADALGLESVRFMPDYQPPHVDQKTALPAKQRLEMLERAISGNPRFGLELAEIRRGGVSYTYETMKALKSLHPEVDYYFIIGGDMVDYLPKWHAIDELVNLVTFVGVVRKGFEKKSAYPIVWVDAPEVEISSTQIRERIAQHQSIRYLVPDAVREYIEEEGLYRDGL